MTHRGPFQPLPFCDSVTRAQTGPTRMLLHPPSLLLTCSMERYAGDGPRPMAHTPSHHSPQNLQPGPARQGKTGTTEGKAGQEGTGERGSCSGRFFAARGLAQPCAEEATRPPCQWSARACRHRQARSLPGRTEALATPPREPGSAFPSPCLGTAAGSV